MRRAMATVARASLIAVALAGIPGTAVAEAPAKKLKSSCEVTIDGKQYKAAATLRHTGGSSSAYYVSKFKTSGPRIDSVRFTLWQDFVGQGEPAQGWPSEPGGIVAKEGLEGNTAYFLPPKETGYAVVYVTENRSLNMDPREKVARLRPHITVGNKTAACWMVFEQPE